MCEGLSNEPSTDWLGLNKPSKTIPDFGGRLRFGCEIEMLFLDTDLGGRFLARKKKRAKTCRLGSVSLNQVSRRLT